MVNLQLRIQAESAGTGKLDARLDSHLPLDPAATTVSEPLLIM